MDALRLLDEKNDSSSCEVMSINRLDMNSLLAMQDSEAGVRELYRTIVDSSEKAAANIQSHVYAHYSEFVLISKEISKLESDMLYIHGMIQELENLDGIWSPISKNNL